MGRKSKLDLRREKAFNKAAKGSKTASFKSSTKSSVPKVPKQPAKQKLIPEGFKAGSARLTPDRADYDALLKKFIEEYKLLVSSKKRGRGSRRGAQDTRDHVLSIDKNEFVKPLVSHQMGEIKKRFGNTLTEQQVIDVTYKTLKTSLRKITSNFATKATLTWKGDELLVEGPGNNFEILQKIITQLKKELRSYGVSLVNNTKRKLNQLEAAEASAVLAITGTDVRKSSLGGDITDKHIDKDIRDGTVILRQDIDHNKLTQQAKTQGLGLQIGHIFGAGLGNIAAFAGTEDGLPDIFHLFSPDAQALLVNIREEAIKVDGNYEVDVRLTEKVGKQLGTISVTVVEGAGLNALTGGSLTDYVKAVRQIVQQEFATIISQYKLSAPILQQVLTRAANLLLVDSKPQKVTTRKRGKRKDKVVVETPVYSVGLTPGARTRGKGKAKSDFQSNDLRQLINIINDRLEEKIQQNMAKGNSKQILNYRTGRFAKSAKLQTLFEVKEKGALGAKVKYMRHPYGVFEPGGRLHKPGRDPHRIFSRSIRQILQEQKLANLRRVKVTLDG